MTSLRSLYRIVTLLAFAAHVHAADAQAKPADVEKRTVNIWSDGTRMAAHLYLPQNRKPDDKLPAIVLCAGTGGTKENTGGRLGPILAQHGYIALAFDYRGWGGSDSRLMSVEPQPKPEAQPNPGGQHEMTIKVKALRGQMSYAEQTEDIRAAISFIVGEPGVDAARIGLWGTSYGGGLVTWVAGNDLRVKCLAAQVPGMGAGNNAAAAKYAYDLATKQARGETEPVPTKSEGAVIFADASTALKPRLFTGLRRISV